MQDFNVNINLTASADLVEAINRLAFSMRGVIGFEPSINMSKNPSEESKNNELPSKEEAQTQTPTPTEEEAQTQTEAKTETYAPEDVRAAIHKARLRIEGDDYMDNPDSELRKRYHSLISKECLKIAQLLGADKPSKLKEEDRKAFIVAVNKLDVLEDGTLGQPKEF